MGYGKRSCCCGRDVSASSWVRSNPLNTKLVLRCQKQQKTKIHVHVPVMPGGLIDARRSAAPKPRTGMRAKREASAKGTSQPNRASQRTPPKPAHSAHLRRSVGRKACRTQGRGSQPALNSNGLEPSTRITIRTPLKTEDYFRNVLQIDEHEPEIGHDPDL